MSDTPDRARILVVDDDRGILRAVERVLAADHDVTAIDRPTEAAERAAAWRPDLAICDVRMPELDGFELLDHLRAACPGIDVILMTGSLTGQDAHLVRALRERVYYFILKPFERDVLLTLVDRCLEARRLRAAERRHLERIEDELDAARAFQQAMLPRSHDCLRGVTIDARCHPCGELGGDLYDYVESRDGRVAFIVADVRGHGVPAALLTGTVKAAFRAGVAARRTPGVIATQLVRALEEFSVDRFVTAFCGMLDPETRALTYVNAGHPAGWAVDAAGDAQPLSSTAPLLSGVFPPDSWTDSVADLPADGRLFLHTDGLTEGPGFVGGDEALPGVVAALCDEVSGGRMLDAVMERMARLRDGRPVSDDITLMVLRMP
ncbi:MAG: PP2C family protein-serine/threonine phosphatase [Planctomycetota bacterium]|jgi:serine phosphatase RsbU (regulator of sigma subunit)